MIFLNLYLKIFVDSFFFILSIQLSCFFNQTDNLLIFNWFRPYVFNVIIDVVDLHLPSCYLFSICSICLLCFLFFPVFIFWFLVSHFYSTHQPTCIRYSEQTKHSPISKLCPNYPLCLLNSPVSYLTARSFPSALLFCDLEGPSFNTLFINPLALPYFSL